MAGRKQKYTAQERREAVELGKDVGPAEAARRLSIPNGTLTCWMYHERKARAAGTEWPTMPEPEPDVDGPLEDTQPEATAKRTARLYTPSERAQALELVGKLGVTATHKKTGISRHSLYAWKHKAERAAQGKGESPTSGPDPHDLRARRDREILDMWKKHPGLGPSQVSNQLARQGLKVSTNTVRRVMEDAGYRPPKVKRSKHDKRFEAARPNHMWHLDFVQRWIGRASTFTLILIDDFSRFIVGHGVDDAERADMVVKTFEEAVARHGKPERVMHDKGSAFWSWKGISRFTKVLEEMEVEQVVAKHKEWNGKVEVFNGNLHKELFDVHRFYDVAEMKRRLANHLHWYNHRRTHHGLGGLLVPADRKYGRVDEVLARIDAGVAADASDALDLRERMLELFKVVSTGGKTEVWLMGQRIF